MPVTWSVQHFDQLGRLFLPRETDEVKGSPLATTTDQGGVKSLSLQRMVVGDGRYELSSNPYREPLANETSPTMGWSWKRFDRAGRLIETREYAGAAKPPPWGVNSNQLGSSVNTYAGDTITVTDAASHGRTSVMKTNSAWHFEREGSNRES